MPFVLKNAASKLKELQTGNGRACATIGALEQLRSKAIFQVAHPAAKGRVTNMQRFGSLPQAAMLRDRDSPPHFL